MTELIDLVHVALNDQMIRFLLLGLVTVLLLWGLIETWRWTNRKRMDDFIEGIERRARERSERRAVNRD